MEDWAVDQNLMLVHDSKLPFSFNSGRWHKGYNPELVFVTDRISKMSVKDIGDPIPKSQHRPVILRILGAVRPTNVPFKRRFNFKKADWESFSTEIDAKICKLDPVSENYDGFITMIKFVSKKTIPRGCRKSYIPGLFKSTTDKLS